jgi:AraC-like DNA-binding protein
LCGTLETMNLSFSTIVGLLGSLQGITLATAIASMGGDAKRPNRALAAIVLVLSATMLVVVVEHAGVTEAPLLLIILEYTLTLLYAPLLWRYVDTVLGRRSGAALGLHFLPLGTWLAYLGAISLGIINRDTWPWPLLPPIMALVIYLAAYTIATAMRVWNARNDERMLITHGLVLRALIVPMLVLHAAQLVRYLFHDVAALTNIVPITGTLIIISISALAFRQSRLFAGYESRGTQGKYRSSTLSAEQAQDVADRLVRVMERDKPYLNESLNAAELAARLSIPRAHLSQVLNSVLELPVRDFINRYRVKEAQRLMEEPAMRHLTVEEIGYAAGFRSRSGFYGAFKRETGRSPAESRPDVY